MGIKAAVFDYGKVICFPPEEAVMENLAALAGLPAAQMDKLVWQFRDDYDRGSIGGEDYYRRILETAGLRPDGELLKKMLRLDLDSWKRLNPETVRLMEELKAAGIKLGILSNMPHDFLAFARAAFPVFSLPDAGVFSCEEGTVKPERKIYEALLDRLGCSPEEVVFFDDISRNVEAAAGLGIRAFLWRDAENGRSELRNLGLPL